MSTFLGSVGTVSLIFGGCCSNVYALESILKWEPGSGLLITLSQFILVTAFVIPSQFDSNGSLKKTHIPLRKLANSALMFFAVNMLNNWAFAFKISVPVHIILRSFGSVTTMGAGWLRGKTFSLLQILSVVLLTIGVIVSAWADALSKGKSMSTDSIHVADPSFEMGLFILLVAQLLSAWMGVYVQDVYAEHGKHWNENLFYSHFFSLPLFLPLYSTLASQWSSVQDTPPLPASSVLADIPLLQSLLGKIPQGTIFLFINSLTQMACIGGVNLLSAGASAVTVTIVLNIRKLVSFILSIILFGNQLGGQMIVGAILVFGSGALYGYETTVRMPAKREQEAKKKQTNANGKKSS